ncbi:hypothetical protein JXB28_05505 [Candidatus Woesearchaeota archaeon]|nr:hypothetical protein [Candidatus Woesearchaeota archaeon]
MLELRKKIFTRKRHHVLASAPEPGKLEPVRVEEPQVDYSSEEKDIEMKKSRSELFGPTANIVSEQLEEIKSQEDNILLVAEQLKKAFQATGKMTELQKKLKQIDEVIQKDDLLEKRKREAKLINTIEEIKQLLKEQRYEDIERLMLKVQHQTEAKVSLSREELKSLRLMMEDLKELYKEAAGLCRLYKLAYDYLNQIYMKCEEELGSEMIEQQQLSRAGTYTQYIP